MTFGHQRAAPFLARCSRSRLVPRHRAAVAHRRRRPPHPGGQVRDGAARRHAAARRPGADRAGRLGRAPRGGAAGGGGVAGRAEERRRHAAAGEDVAGIALGGKTADNIGNQCGGWTVTWQGMSGAVITGRHHASAQALEAGRRRRTSCTTRWTAASTATAPPVGIAVIGETPYSEGAANRADRSVRDRPTRRWTAPTCRWSDDEAGGAEGGGGAGGGAADDPRPDPAIRGRDRGGVAARAREGAGVTDVLFGDVHPTGKLPHDAGRAAWRRSRSTRATRTTILCSRTATG